MSDRTAALPPTRIGFFTRLKWLLFRAIERLNPGTIEPAQGMPQGAPRDALWVFVSTIGELNAIGPFLKQLATEYRPLQLVLVSDRRIYRAAYLAQYPLAEVIEIGADNATPFALAQARPPRLFVVAEIPCLPSDAPCRMPFGYLLAAKRTGAAAILVNGWRYGYTPPCRMDSIERSLLGRDSLRLFDLLCVQSEAVASSLIAAGASPARVQVTGNIKFDGMDTSPRALDQTRSPQLLVSLAQGTRPVVVAGCVTDDEERDLVLDAFDNLRLSQPAAVLVLAPRHPENPKVMQSLDAALRLRHLPYRLHSASNDGAFAKDADVLVLDTMGELRDFYAVANVAHVGRDHNVLEPLFYGIPVTVRAGWDKTYPSYPVYRLMHDSRVLAEYDNAMALSSAWQAVVADHAIAVARRGLILQTVTAKIGASARCMQQVARVVDSQAVTWSARS